MFVDPCIIVQFIKKNPTRCKNVSKFLLFHIYMKLNMCQAQYDCAWQRPPTARPTTFHVWKTRGCQCSFRLLMMGGVSPETCWASYKYGIIKILIHFCILLYFSLWVRLVTKRHNVVADHKPDDGNQYSRRNVITAKKLQTTLLYCWL